MWKCYRFAMGIMTPKQRNKEDLPDDDQLPPFQLV